MTHTTENQTALPVVSLRDTVLYPGLFIPLAVGRPQSMAAIDAVMETEEKTFIVAAQRDSEVEEPGIDDLYTIATRAVVKKAAKEDGHYQLLVQGVERVTILKCEQTQPFLKATYSQLPISDEHTMEVEALQRAIAELAERMMELVHTQMPFNIQQVLGQHPDALHQGYLLASMLELETSKAQQLLEVLTRVDALRMIHGFLAHEIQVLELRAKIADQAEEEMSKDQREYMLRQQMRAIQEELGEDSPEKAEVAELRKRLDEKELPEEVLKEAERELSRLERLPPAAPDFQVIRNYLELILELPWKERTDEAIDLAKAKSVLEEDHFGLEDVKERILDDLAVLKLNPEAKAPILCLVGPPGVGKTSIGKSIARAIGRKFERMSLGGLHDEAELRGHRRTYIGAMPGRILQAMRRAGSRNPVLMLDEIDKMGRDFRGDPAAALLEILDPAQNHEFRDNFLNLPFDLSSVLFITTANSLDTIPQPLLDRMEVIRLSGYSEEEKVQIARRYLLPRQIKETGLETEQLTLTNELLLEIVRRYTREAGVRNLERSLGQVARKVARRIAEGTVNAVSVEASDLSELMGPEKFRPERARHILQPGVSTGLAWTEAGGDVLYVETSLLRDGKGMRITGQLGDVMRESARAAQTYVWSHAEVLGIDPELFRKSGLHVHVPAGGIPKDGPSAGVTLATALASLCTDLPVRHDVAMTGEITLSGLVLPVGGIKEKVLAARRAGINDVILPKANAKDLEQLPEEVQQSMSFTLAEHIDDVLKTAIPQLASRLNLEPIG